MDVHSPEQRRFNMSRIRGKDTRPEMAVRKWLWANGYRYRLHKKDLPGKPDIVLPKYHAVIFVHGCFWHRHGCKFSALPATRREFWEAKFIANVTRDIRNKRLLESAGWRVLQLWECEINKWNEEMASRLHAFLSHNETATSKSTGTQCPP